MADRPTEKKETAKKDEAYQPLWDLSLIHI